jgi:RNA polymerase sigma-70 factor (ECF subfamily)
LRRGGEQGFGHRGTHPDETAAVEGLRRGERTEENARVLHDLYYHRLRAYFSRRGRSSPDVQDLTQETFIKVYSNIGRYRGESRFSTWVFAIARNVLLKWGARRRPEEAGAGEAAPDGNEPAAAGPDPETVVRDRELRELVRRTIEVLPPRQRQCMVLRVVQGLKYEQIATVMGISINSVKAHLNQGRSRLEELFSETARALPRWLPEDPGGGGGGRS